MLVKYSATTVDCYYKNIARHTAHTVVSLPSHKQWLMFWFDDDDDDDDDDDNWW